MPKPGLSIARRAHWTPPDFIDPGNELPLSVEGPLGAQIDRHHLSIIWLSGIVLTAVWGVALMTAAALVSFKGMVNIASVPPEVALRGVVGIGAAPRGDRLPLALDLPFHRQFIRLSTVGRAGNHEVVQARRFVRLTGLLPLTGSRLLGQIPPLNPQRLLAQSVPGRNARPEEELNPQVSFVLRDLSPFLPRLQLKIVTPSNQVRWRVRDVADWGKGTTTLSAKRKAVTGIKVAYAGAADYPGLIAPIVPANITIIPKTSATTTGGVPFERRIIDVKKDNSIATILRGLGSSSNQINAIDDLLGRYGSENGLVPGDRVRVLLSPESDNKRSKPVRVIIADGAGPQAVVALSSAGNYVAVDPGRIDRELVKKGDEEAGKQLPTGVVSLYESFYETALRHHVPRAIINGFLRIFAFDIDLNRRVHVGDSFSILYARNKHGLDAANIGNDILFASLTVDGRTRKLYRFRMSDRASVDYYSPRGETVRPFLLRKPMPVGRLTSGFGWRKHPILGIVLMHTGIDWAAPMGTPVYAAGGGVIEREGWESGYGKFMLLRHAYGFETAYAHLSGYARGTHVGEHVRQGQVIAFVGSTGLSTGPHLNFEFRINGHFVNPLRIKLPHEHVLRGAELARFHQECKRLNMVMMNHSPQIASHS